MYDVNSDGYQDVVVFGETTQHDGTIEIYTANKHGYCLTHLRICNIINYEKT